MERLLVDPATSEISTTLHVESTEITASNVSSGFVALKCLHGIDLSFPCVLCGRFTYLYNFQPQQHQLCPVCEGRGNVSHGFYERAQGSDTKAEPELCRRCWGMGTIQL